MYYLIYGLLFVPFLVLADTSAFKKVTLVIFENANYGDVIHLPFFNKLAKEGALLKNFHAERHPSQPNYIALISGDTYGCKDDDNIDIRAPNITDLLEARGRTWKVYAESYPGGCFKGKSSGTYVRKHNPFISFKSVQNSPTKCDQIVEASVFKKDITNGSLPDYSFYIPDMNNDGHDTSAKYADRWYGKTFGPLLSEPKFMDGMLLVTTFDESSLFELTNHIYTSFYGSGVKTGTISKKFYNHYNILRTIEEAFGLGTMAKGDGPAALIDDIWQ
jgi:hypothetical protein